MDGLISPMTQQMPGRDVLAELADLAGPTQRASAAGYVGRQFCAGALSDSERLIAEDIFFLMVRDVAEVVREALSHAVKLATDLPPDIARALAFDSPAVALPFLAVSQVLSDADLISVIALRPVDYALAIAGRAAVSAPVADALVATADGNVVAVLAGNAGADIAEPTFEAALALFAAEPRITSALAMRDNLPVRIAERLVTLVSDKIRHHLVSVHGVADDTAEDIALATAERGTDALLDQVSDLPDVLGLVEHLHSCHRLSPTLIIRALDAGDVDFAESVIARLAQLPAAVAHQLIRGAGGRAGLARLFAHARVPDAYVQPVEIALRHALAAKTESNPAGPTARLRDAWAAELPAHIMAQLTPLLALRSPR